MALDIIGGQKESTKTACRLSFSAKLNKKIKKVEKAIENIDDEYHKYTEEYKNDHWSENPVA
jgi:hypothetical protein